MKLIRRDAFPLIKQSLGVFGDDSHISELCAANGFKVAFCKDIFCLHAGQCKDWGYKKSELLLDPRKSGYGPYFQYEYDELTYEPKYPWRLNDVVSRTTL